MFNNDLPITPYSPNRENGSPPMARSFVSSIGGGSGLLVGGGLLVGRVGGSLLVGGCGGLIVDGDGSSMLFDGVGGLLVGRVGGRLLVDGGGGLIVDGDGSSMLFDGAGGRLLVDGGDGLVTGGAGGSLLVGGGGGLLVGGAGCSLLVGDGDGLSVDDSAAFLVGGAGGRSVTRSVVEDGSLVTGLAVGGDLVLVGAADGGEVVAGSGLGRGRGRGLGRGRYLVRSGRLKSGRMGLRDGLSPVSGAGAEPGGVCTDAGPPRVNARPSRDTEGGGGTGRLRSVVLVEASTSASRAGLGRIRRRGGAGVVLGVVKTGSLVVGTGEASLFCSTVCCRTSFISTFSSSSGECQISIN